MEIIADTSEFYIERETAVAIGKFDGVHLGHRRLLDEVLQAKKRGLAACVFTFDPPPSVLFGGDAHVLTTNEEKHRIFERMGVDFLVEFPMTLETAAIPPSTFIVDYLVGQLNTKFIVAGTDISFGRRGEGNAALLKAMASEYDYDFKLIDKVKTPDGEEISSSLVRECIAIGNMEKAEGLLGAPYSVTGTVVKGNHIGHTLGFPTINIYPDENKLLPPFGVYAGKTEVKEKVYRSISNVGCKPTVGGEVRPSVETYLYDFDGDLYGKEATVELSAFRRPETKFESLDALKAQLQRDIGRY
ncbi:MAG: bifunctional riboflavin kinase/FAD synthetase [Lachnospiraceae bacterium]|nr:bifunctional riboflavin kinase/FAD synthetase [Lachnospiraceae bacterium]